MPEATITRDQLKRLQTLWGQYARREMIANHREARLTWAGEQLGHFISSFSDLTISEASALINVLQGSMGIAESSPAARPRRYRSRIKDRDRAHAAGTEGRRGGSNTSTMSTAEDLAMIDAQLTEMGWTRERLDAFLASPSSPIGRSSQIRTVRQINKVLWALKGIAKRQAKQEAGVGQ